MVGSIVLNPITISRDISNSVKLAHSRSLEVEARIRRNSSYLTGNTILMTNLTWMRELFSGRISPK
jgi:hypothetical protein